MKHQKGFTIIELIVVIAIIAVLATIVLVNVTQYINKGKDAAIKGNMNTLATNAAVFLDTNSTYVGFNLTTVPAYQGPVTAINAAKSSSFGTPQVAASTFCFTATLYDTTTYCVDSSGYKGALGTGGCDSGTPLCN